jgi:nitroreductase
MSEIIDLIYKRRSIRKYSEREVEQDTIITLLKAAMAAPSAMNSQPWEFVVITDKMILENLKSKLPFGKYNAPVAIVVCGNPDIAHNRAGHLFWVQDCSAAVENLLIAATGLGLGTVWIGVHSVPLLPARVSKVCQLPKHVHPLNVVYVGYPAEEKPPHTKYEERRVHWQRY